MQNGNQKTPKSPIPTYSELPSASFIEDGFVLLTDITTLNKRYEKERKRKEKMRKLQLQSEIDSSTPSNDVDNVQPAPLLLNSIDTPHLPKKHRRHHHRHKNREISENISISPKKKREKNKIQNNLNRSLEEKDLQKSKSEANESALSKSQSYIQKMNTPFIDDSIVIPQKLRQNIVSMNEGNNTSNSPDSLEKSQPVSAKRHHKKHKRNKRKGSSPLSPKMRDTFLQMNDKRSRSNETLLTPNPNKFNQDAKSHIMRISGKKKLKDSKSTRSMKPNKKGKKVDSELENVVATPVLDEPELKTAGLAMKETTKQSFDLLTSGLKPSPLENMPEKVEKPLPLQTNDTITIDPQTNAFTPHKSGRKRKGKKRSNENLYTPIEKWYPFQVNIIDSPDDTKIEEKATKEFDLSTLIKGIKE